MSPLFTTRAILLYMPKVLNFRAIIEQDASNLFVASVPAVPGCHTQGNTYEEALTNIKEALEVCLEEARENKNYSQKINWPTDTSHNNFLGITNIQVQVPHPA